MDDSSDRQRGCFAELAEVFADQCDDPTAWRRHAWAWLLQGGFAFRDDDQQQALQQEYLGTPQELAELAPAAAATRLADGLAQAFVDLWCEDVLLAARLRPGTTSPWRLRPANEAVAQTDKFAAWSLEVILRATQEVVHEAKQGASKKLCKKRNKNYARSDR